MSLIAEYPLWFILFCLVAGMCFAALLYWRERKHVFGKTLTRILFAFRAVAVAILAFLLLNPLIKRLTYASEAPVIIIAQDNSQSVAATKDSLYYRGEYLSGIKELKKRLDGDFDVRFYSFGSQVAAAEEIDYSEKVTDFSLLLDELGFHYANANVGAVILASDGIYNRGYNPGYYRQAISAPVYTIALGDTNVYRDLLIYKIHYNRLAYLHNEFPLHILVHARKAAGLKTRLSVEWENSILFSKIVEIKGDDEWIEAKINLKATSPGVQRYRISVAGVEGEVTLLNNTEDIFIEILDGKQKILLLHNAPHPDVSALKEVIRGNINYEVDDYLAGDFEGQAKGYNLVILHQLPGLKNPLDDILSEASEFQIPLLIILGPQSDLVRFNEIKTGMKIVANKTVFQEALPAGSDGFGLFDISPEFRELLPHYPPLIVPFGEYRLTPSVAVAFRQKIGQVVTDFPLLMIDAAGETKIGVISGTGIWRWRMAAFAKEGNHQGFDDLMSRIIQYLSVKTDKSHFRVFSRKNSYLDTENIEFEAELYTDDYELTDRPDVQLELKSADGSKFLFAFARSGGKYYLNAGNLPPGAYTFEGKVKDKAMEFTATGEFSVSSLGLETKQTVADHTLLFSLAEITGGKMIYPEDMLNLHTLISEHRNVKPVVYEQQRFTGLINIFWIMALVMALLAAEWFLRKRSGSY